MVRKFLSFRSKRKKRSTSEGTPQFPNRISRKLTYHLTSNGNFEIFLPNSKHPKPYVVPGWNQTLATFVEDKSSHHYTILAPEQLFNDLVGHLFRFVKDGPFQKFVSRNLKLVTTNYLKWVRLPNQCNKQKKQNLYLTGRLYNSYSRWANRQIDTYARHKRVKLSSHFAQQ